MKLIKINTDHYVIVDDSEIKEGDFVYDSKDKVIRFVKQYLPDEWIKKITHSTNILTNGMGILYLSEVKELIGEVDVEKKVRNEMGIPDYLPTNSMSPPMQGSLEFGIKCYNQALEDNKDKKYTEEDLKRYHNIMCLHGNKKGEEFIQSLQPKTEWEVEFDNNGKLKLK